MVHVIFVAGLVISQNDNQEHYVSGRQLARLYCIPSSSRFITYVTVEKGLPRIMLGLDSSKVLVLRPDPTGQYQLSSEQWKLIT